jgi:adenylosuccinate synthase
MAGTIQVIVGGQFGSEGKGHCAAELAKWEEEMLAIRTGGPNAGHTAWSERTEHKLRQVPVASVVNPKATCALSAGSLVQLDLTEREVNETGIPTLLVDSSATILEPAHAVFEQGDDALAWGSTRKGIGAARMDRLHRTARTWADVVPSYAGTHLLECHVAELARQYLESGLTVQIEAAQGYGLGLHTEFYPKTTSADCRAIDALADVGISPWEFPEADLDIWVVIRPYPIRVAGDSGPLKFETSWEALGLPEERTTVTNKVRRVGAWDPGLVAEAVRANGRRYVRLWMNMADHVFPFLSHRTTMGGLNPRDIAKVTKWLDTVESQTGAPVYALGTGPATAILLGH